MTTPPPIRHLSPAETAAALGVTVRALRLYEQKGLVCPTRTAAGWRVYGPESLARLHQILVLKRLGLGLKPIGDLLRGRLGSLDAVLALQQQVLRDRLEETERALQLLAAARRKIAAGATLSLEDLTALTTETTMTEQLTPQAWSEIFAPLIEKHYTSEERRAFQSRMPPSEALEAENRIWDGLIAETKALMAAGISPVSANAISLARRWDAQVRKAYGDDPTLIEKGRAMWGEAFADPGAAPRLPFDVTVWRYIEEAMKAAGAAGA